ncbi:MAG: 50S ribosomal protein L21 [Verrucomicrobiia bacterium]
MGFAVIRTGGKQYKVAQGDMIEIEKLNQDLGSKTEFPEVLLYADDSGVQVGKPLLKSVKVAGEIVGQMKAPKVVAYKFKRRKGYHRTVGHRQQLTRVKITSIEA